MTSLPVVLELKSSGISSDVFFGACRSWHHCLLERVGLKSSGF